MKRNLILLAALLLCSNFLPAQRIYEYDKELAETNWFSYPCTGLEDPPGCCTSCQYKERMIQTEYPPYIIDGGRRTYFFTDGDNSSVAYSPLNMLDVNEINFKTNGSDPVYVTQPSTADTWRYSYYSVYSAQYVNHPTAGPVSMGFTEGENYSLTGTSPCYWMGGSTAVTFLCLTWTPNTPATNYGHQYFTDMGPIIWPATGYYYNGQKSSQGCANNNTIQADGYLYVFYNDQSCEDVSAQMGPGRYPGIKVARAPISDALNPLAYKTFYKDANGIIHWNQSLPAGFNKDNIDSYLSTPGPQGTPILEPDRNYTRFAVAKVAGTDYYMGLGNYQSPNGQITTLKYSRDLLHWEGDRTIYTASSYLTSKFNYPIFLSADGRSNTTINENNFYIIGTEPEAGGIDNNVNKLRVYIPPPPHIPCNWYMHIERDPSTMDGASGSRLGDIDITGDKLTVEAVFNRTEDFSYADNGGDLISKHCNSTDMNYLLRPEMGAITTTNGYFQVDLCALETNTTYHVAMVYDGAHLTLYRNGFLISSIPATGNLITNDWETTIGTAACFSNWSLPVHFRGYVGEVRIWKKARTQQEIRTYCNRPLSSYNDPDLVGYTTNGGGGSNFGNVSFHQTNPNCIPDNVGCYSFARTAASSVSSAMKPSVNNATEASAASNVIVYPNPAGKSTTLRYSSNAAGTITIHVTDVTGKRAMVMKKSVMKGSNAINLDLNSLSNGVYFVQLFDDKKMLTKKLIISK